MDTLAVTADIPLWSAIVGTTIILRTCMLPISIVSMKMTARMTKAKPELEIIQERMKSDPNQADPKRASMYSRQMHAVLAKHNCRPLLVFVFPIIQLPVFTSMFFGLRRMGEHVPAMTTGGTLWFPDLTVADPTMVLPFLTAGLFLGMVELGADGMTAQSPSNQRNFKWGMRALACAMVPMTYFMPAGVFCYWLTANSYSVLQTAFLNKVPGVREALGIPSLTRPASFSHIWRPKPFVPVPGAKDTDILSDFYKALTKARNAASGQQAPGPPVSADDFAKKKVEDHFLASRSNTPVQTFTAEELKAKGLGPFSKAPSHNNPGGRKKRGGKK